MVSQIQQF